MLRVVGTQDRDEFVLDRTEAWRRGRSLDRMLRSSLPPVARGVLRLTHGERNRLDDLRALEAARRLNAA